MIKWRCLSACCLLALGLLRPTAGTATTLIVPDTAALAQASDAIVLARVEGIGSAAEETASGTRFRTRVGLAVERTLKGTSRPHLDIVEPGGVVGGRGRWIIGAPAFAVGERVLLFLRRTPTGDFTTAFLGLGKFAVTRDGGGNEIARRGILGVRALRWTGARLAPAPAADAQPLADMLQRVAELGASDTAGAPPAGAPALDTVGGPSTLESFTFDGPPLLRWFLADEGQPVAYVVSAGGDAALGAGVSAEAVDAALAAWSSPACTSLRLTDAGTAPPSSFDTCDGVTEITFNDPLSQIDDPVNCSGVLALGGVCADGSVAATFNGAAAYRITEGDILINNGFGGCPFWTATNLAEILTHEVGHTIGLGHSSDDPNEPDPTLRNATMYYAAHFDGRGATLTSDDVAAVCTLYPAADSGSVSLRRFALVSDGAGPAGADRLVVEGALALASGPFDPQSDTLIIDILSAGASVFRLAVPPGTWLVSSSRTRFLYRGTVVGAATRLLVTVRDTGDLQFRLSSRGLQLAAMPSGPVVMSFAVGTAAVTQPVPPLRASSRGRVYP